MSSSRQTALRPRQRPTAAVQLAAVLLASTVLALTAGCASTGPPRPPSLHLPQPVRDLSAQRFGNRVELRFTVPTLSTDRQPLAGRKRGAGTLSAQLCRQASPTDPLCTAVATQNVDAGQSLTLTDSLPAPLLAGAPRPLRYRVTIVNGQGRSAGPSRDAATAAGEAPLPLRNLAARTTAQGIQLTWLAEPRAQDSQTRLVITTAPTPRTLTVPGDPGGATDAAPRPGDTVTYTVVRTRKVPAAQTGTAADLVLSGDPASITAVRSADVFPPATPTGLVAVAVQMQGAPPEIDLSWEPDADEDLAGYIVERSEARAAAVLLTPAPIAAISLRDMAVQPGHTYSYTVRAVDTAGNRSRPSAAATETVRP